MIVKKTAGNIFFSRYHMHFKQRFTGDIYAKDNHQRPTETLESNH